MGCVGPHNATWKIWDNFSREFVTPPDVYYRRWFFSYCTFFHFFLYWKSTDNVDHEFNVQPEAYCWRLMHISGFDNGGIVREEDSQLRAIHRRSTWSLLQTVAIFFLFTRRYSITSHWIRTKKNDYSTTKSKECVVVVIIYLNAFSAEICKVLWEKYSNFEHSIVVIPEAYCRRCQRRFCYLGITYFYLFCSLDVALFVVLGQKSVGDCSTT